LHFIFKITNIIKLKTNIQITMDFISFREEAQEAFLSFKGDLTINHIEVLKKELNSIFATEITSIQVNFQEVKSIDMSFVQLWGAFVNSLEKQEKTWEITHQLPDDLLSLIQKAGVKVL